MVQEDRRRPGEQPDQRREPPLQRLGERQHGLGRRAGRSGAARVPVRQLDQVLPVRQRPVRPRLDGRVRQLRFEPLVKGQLDVRRQPRGFRSGERGRSGRHADPRDHERRSDGIQRHRSRGRRQHGRGRWRRDHLEPGSDSGCASADRSRTGPAASARCCLRSASPPAAAGGAGRTGDRLDPPVPPLPATARRLAAAADLGRAAPRHARPASRVCRAGRRALPHPSLFLRPLRSARPIRSRRRRRELLLPVEGGLVVDDVLERARLREDQRGLPPAEQHLDRDGAAERADHHPRLRHLRRRTTPTRSSGRRITSPG